MGSVITTHLIDGDPQGIRSIFMKNKTCQMFVIPREYISKAFENKDINLKQPALYIILENISSSDGDKPRAYIGHAEDVGKRINQHLKNQEKTEIFDTLLIFVSRDSSINKADVQYLENKAIIDAQKASRYNLLNENSGTSPHLSPDQRDVIEEFSEFVWLLTSFYGCKIFTPTVSEATAKKNSEKQLFSLKWAGLVARAIYGNGEIVILKGSELRITTLTSASPENREKRLERLNCTKLEDRYILQEDTPFSSPSTAAWIVSGVRLNGWINWKNAKGKTLDEIYRHGK